MPTSQATALSSTNGPRHEPFIDGLRGLSILAVMACHTLDHAVLLDGRFPPRSPWLFRLAINGQYGVELFFVISAYTLLLSTRARSAESHPRRNFYLRRLFRIVPPLWLAIGWYALQKGRRFSTILPSLLLYSGFLRFRPAVDVFDAQWSIFVEETFYLLLPWLLPRLTTARAAAYFFCFMFYVAAAWRWGAPLAGIPEAHGFVYWFPLHHWDFFALGIWLALAPPERFRALSKTGPLLALLAGVCFLALPAQAPRLALIPCTLLFLAAREGSGLFAKLVRTRWLGWYGRFSYTLYLAHLGLITALEPLRHRLFVVTGLLDAAPELRFLLWFLVVSLLCFPLGWLGYHAFELPWIRWGKRLIARLERSASAPAPLTPDLSSAA